MRLPMLPYTRRAAPNRNIPAITKQATEGNTPASPLRHQASRITNGISRRCGSGSHTVPIWSGPGVRESRIRRAMFRCASASP